MSYEQKELQQSVLFALENFSRMQKEHLKLFMAGKLAKVDSWQQKRRFLSHAVQQALSGLVENGLDVDAEFAVLVDEKILKIQQEEKLLAAEVIRLKDAVKEKMNQMRRGKKALSGYGMKSMTPAGPRFLSSRG